MFSVSLDEFCNFILYSQLIVANLKMANKHFISTSKNQKTTEVKEILFGFLLGDGCITKKIQDFLGVSKVVVEDSSCLFIISNVKSLLTILFPLLVKYYLYTTKWLDYLDLKSVVLFLS